jgi:MFS transporter, OFA family, oxalate/formate antiporter
LVLQCKQGQAALLISAIGIASTTGRISLGYLADVLGRLFVLNTSLVMCSVSTVLWLFCHQFWNIALYGVVYGLFSGSMISLVSPLLAENYPDHRDKMSSILGMPMLPCCALLARAHR